MRKTRRPDDKRFFFCANRKRARGKKNRRQRGGFVRPQARQRFDELFCVVEKELHATAEHLLRARRRGFTLEASDLVQMAYLRMAEASQLDLQGRTHLRVLAGKNMVYALIDYYRHRSAKKRAPAGRRDRIHDELGEYHDGHFQLLVLKEAMECLYRTKRRLYDAFVLYCFAGFSPEEIAEHNETSLRTAQRDVRDAVAIILSEFAGTS